tara:strand:+ start:31091 stop:31591 length:501 start_codon:yes stop_codon:yes gene_type:complete
MRYLQNISNPISKGFKIDVLKMNMDKLVEFTLESKPPSIFKQFKEEEEKTIDIVSLMLIEFQDFYNCKGKMNKGQIVETAYLICQHFRHFNYYDIALCFKNAKMNEKIYDRVDGGMIMEWLTLHDINRTGLVVTEREKVKAQNNAEWSALGERSSVQKLKQFLKGE